MVPKIVIYYREAVFDPQTNYLENNRLTSYNSQPTFEVRPSGLLRNTKVKQIINFLREEDGPTAVEYAVMLALIVVVCLVSIRTIGQNLNKNYDQIINAQIEAAKSSP